MPNKKNKKQYLIIAVATLLVIAIGFTAAYFQAQIGNGATANVTVTTKTTDTLTFNKGNDITITATQANFGSGAGNRTGTTTATATLLANNDTNSATNTYNVYLYIQANNFEYTTSPTNTPELMLTITDPNNQAVTSLTGLTYTTSGGVSGFDITTKSGLIQIASNYTITSTGTKTDTWNITVSLINLNSDQQANTDKTFTGQIIIQKDAISTSYWNDNFNGSYMYSYPLGERTSMNDYWDYFDGNLINLSWTNGSPTTYSILAQLQSNYGYFSTNPMYIKTTVEHQVCLYYNNHEFCLSPYYWEERTDVYASVLATMNKLQADMETSLGTSANENECISTVERVWCYFGDFHCDVTSYGYVFCESDVSGAGCAVGSDGAAGCALY